MKFTLISESVRASAMTVIKNLPVDGSMDVIVQPFKRVRSPSQNSLMWGAMLSDIAEQAWVEGKQYHSDVWHEHLKREFLPEGNEEDYERMVTKDYRKWEYLPNGERVCIGSTTHLTTFGMNWYLGRVERYAAHDLGVRFSAK